MNKEQKYTSIELSKKIYDLAKKKGIELPESELYWKKTIKKDNERNFGKYYLIHNTYFCKENRIPAYDTAELGMILPDQTICRKDFIKTTQNTIYSVDVADIEIKENIFAYTEAEARGKMYFYLLDNNLL